MTNTAVPDPLNLCTKGVHMRRELMALLVTASLTGCGGGGGGGGGNVIVPPPAPIEPAPPVFTSFPAFPLNQPVTIAGISEAASGSQTSGTTITITSVDSPTVDTSNTSVTLTKDNTGVWSAASIATPQASLSFSRTAGDGITCSSGVCLFASTASASEAILIDPSFTGWNYQTFGTWDKELSPTSFQTGVFSVGGPTPASAVPTVGMATFIGLASGFYVDTAGAPFFSAASMTATADFGARSIAFSTSNTQLVNLNTSASSADNNLNLSGTFTYAAGANLFSGAVTTSNAALSGAGTGRFYGPNAEEIGGIYGLTGTGVSRMIGGFGGKR